MRLPLAAGLGVLLGGAALAASDHIPTSEYVFRHLDSDHSGELSLLELEGRQNSLSNFDSNKDGTVSPQELDAGLAAEMAKRRKAILGAYDTNKDGSLSNEELNGALKHRFDELDTNKDGALSWDEITAGRLAKIKPASPESQEDEGDGE